MSSDRNPYSPPATGITTGTPFNTNANARDPRTANITRIVVTYSTYITSIDVYYTDASALPTGQLSSNQTAINLRSGEFITTVEGTFTPNVISKILFKTNLGATFGPYAQTTYASTFTWGGYGVNMGLFSLGGYASGGWLTGLSATFALYTPNIPPVVKYEKRRDDGPDTPRKDTLSKYAKVLMSPSITVITGEDSIKFHVPEDILCLLERFHEAIHKKSGDMSAQDRGTINLGNEEPEIIAAMIEFLSTGSYTYTYPVPDGWTSGRPPSDLEEGQFHVDMYDLATRLAPKKPPAGSSKKVLDAYKKFYDTFKRFQDATIRCFLYVLRQLKGMDIIDLWKSAYDKGLTFAVWKKDDSDYVAFKKEASSLLDLLKTDKDRMDTIRKEQRQLWDDLNDLRQGV